MDVTWTPASAPSCARSKRFGNLGIRGGIPMVLKLVPEI